MGTCTFAAAGTAERRMIMTCEQCKYITVCMAQADCLGQIFDPNYDGEHGCTDFAPCTNADRIRSMTDEELSEFFDKFRACSVCAYNDGDCSKCKDGIFEWLQQPAEGE